MDGAKIFSIYMLAVTVIGVAAMIYYNTGNRGR
jgi:hypothetical protein